MSDPRDERIVVLAPTARDAPLTTELLGRAGFSCTIARDADALCAELLAGAGAAIVAEEALGARTARRLADLLSAQEPWSDLPVLIFTGKDGRVRGARATLQSLAPFGNVTLLERPVQAITLLSAVRAALRARRRQYAARAVLLDLVASQEELRASEARFRTMADETPVMIWVTDAAGRIEFVNRAWCEFFGVSLDRARAEGWEALVHPDDSAAYAGAFAAALGARAPFHARARVARADGEWRWIESYGSPRLTAAGDLAGMAGSSPDVTGRILAEEALRESDRRKTEFLGVLSHELRNPLAPILNSVHVLREAPPGSPPALRATAVIERQAAHLARMVDDLLDVTRVERGKIMLERSTLDLREVVRRTAEDHRGLLEARGVELRVEADGPAWVDADATRLAQVVGNLLQNAAKFTPSGGLVQVTVAAEGDRAELRVRDDGAGIPPDLLPRLFTPFVQAEGGMARTKGGLGLGLAFVKGIVELHGGAVRASSPGAGAGAEFAVSLPLAPPPSREAPPPAATEPPPPQALVILVVDDNVDAAEAVAETLRLAGCDVHVASDGRSGLEKARALRPQAVVCDLGLPDLDGYELARALRKERALAEARLIALSGYAGPEDLERAKEAGFDVHLAKPASIAQLLASLAG